MTAGKKLWRNRKEKKEWARRLQSEDPGLEVVHPHAAGIDVGNSAHYVAVRPDRDSEPVQRFECFTADLHRIADWLQSCGRGNGSHAIDWRLLDSALRDPGRAWFGGLPGERTPYEESARTQERCAGEPVVAEVAHLWAAEQLVPTRLRDSRLRTYWRQRGEHVRGAATCIQRMQKALTQMNVQLANVISDISGLTGQAIIRAIVTGERDPGKLARLSDRRVHASQAEIAKSLEGNWRSELLFVLQQEVDMYDIYQKRISECDQQLQKQLARLTGFPTGKEPTQKAKTKQAAAKNAPRFDLSSELQRVTGVDLTRIDGIDVMTAQTLLSEVGLDMSRWKTEAHFASWLGLCPDNRISGDKVLARGTRRVVNRAATALRQAANTLIRSRSYLGAQYRRLRTKLGAPKAITAMAHRLARLVYRMLKYGQASVDKGTEYYEERFRQQQIQLLRKRAAKLGLQIAEIQA